MSNNKLSDFAESLAYDDDPEFKTFLLEQLSHAERNLVHGVMTPETGYWQGRKDAFRLTLACYLNQPEIADLIRSSAFRDVAKADYAEDEDA